MDAKISIFCVLAFLISSDYLDAQDFESSNVCYIVGYFIGESALV